MIFNLCGGGVDKSKGLTATVTDILKGKTALVNGEVLTGEYVPDTGYKVKTGVVTASNNSITITSDGAFNIEGFIAILAEASANAYGKDAEFISVAYYCDSQNKLRSNVTCVPTSNPYAKYQHGSSSFCSINGNTAQVTSNTNINSGDSWRYVCWGK